MIIHNVMDLQRYLGFSEEPTPEAALREINRCIEKYGDGYLCALSLEDYIPIKSQRWEFMLRPSIDGCRVILARRLKRAWRSLWAVPVEVKKFAANGSTVSATLAGYLADHPDYITVVSSSARTAVVAATVDVRMPAQRESILALHWSGPGECEGTETLRFPFTSQQYDNAVKCLEDTAADCAAEWEAAEEPESFEPEQVDDSPWGPETASSMAKKVATVNALEKVLPEDGAKALRNAMDNLGRGE